jgi:hypothetical protein
MQQDEENLRLLSIFHYVVGGLAALLACFPIIHVIVGIALIVWSADPDPNGEAPPAFVGWLFVGFASVGIIVGWCVAVCIITAGRFLAQCKHYTFCLVVAATECLFMPFGTVLGVFTIVVLVRENVKEMFAANGSLHAMADGRA